MKKLSVRESFSFGWRTFKARPWFFVLVTFIILVISGVSGSFQGIATELLGKLVGGGISGVTGLIIDTFIGMGLVALYLKAYDSVMTPTFMDLWNPRPFFRFFFAYLMLAVILLTGYILLIIPGIILTLMLCFTTTIVIDKKSEPIAAMKESARITKGQLVPVGLLILSVAGVNVLGTLTFGVGLLVSMPVSMLALVHAYRTLSTPPDASLTAS